MTPTVTVHRHPTPGDPSTYVDQTVTVPAGTYALVGPLEPCDSCGGKGSMRIACPDPYAYAENVSCLVDHFGPCPMCGGSGYDLLWLAKIMLDAKGLKLEWEMLGLQSQEDFMNMARAVLEAIGADDE